MVADTALRIEYPGRHEEGDEPDPHIELIAASHVDGDVFRLEAHSKLIPLAPGDLVTAKDGVITGVEKPTEDWVIEVYLKLEISDWEGQRRLEVWSRDVRTTSTTEITTRISSSTKQWVDDVIVTDPDVLDIDVLRRPGDLVDFEAEVAKR